jgi:hypothetical protein
MLASAAQADRQSEPAAARIAVVIPALNEEQSIGEVVRDIAEAIVARIIVADGGSNDATQARAAAAGAQVIAAGKGYGRACWEAVQAASSAEIIVFMDGDGADDPRFIASLTAPIRSDACDLVLGSRARGAREPGSMAWHQLAAGRAAGFAMRLLYGVRYTDMCAFRAIRRQALIDLGMREMGYGWNIEMQMRAARQGLRILEIPIITAAAAATPRSPAACMARSGRAHASSPRSGASPCHRSVMLLMVQLQDRRGEPMLSKRHFLFLLLAAATVSTDFAPASAQSTAPDVASVRVSELIGLPIVDSEKSVMGRVHTVVRTRDGMIELIMPIGGLFGFGERLVPIPIEMVALAGRELAVIEVPPDRFQQSPTWYGSNSEELGPGDTIQIAKR